MSNDLIDMWNRLANEEQQIKPYKNNDDWQTFHRPIQYIKLMKLYLFKIVEVSYGSIKLPKDIIDDIKKVEDLWYTQDLKTSYEDFQNKIIKPAYDKLYKDLDIEQNIEKVFTNAQQDVNVILEKQEKERKKKVKPLSNIQSNIIQNLALKKRNEATEEIVKYLMDNNKFYSIINNVSPEIWRYDNGIYIDDGISYIKETCRNLFLDAYNSHLSNNVIAKIEADCFIDANSFFNTPEINYICVENGLINIKTKQLEPYSDDKIFFNKMPVVYDATKQCPNIIKHFETILKNPEDIQTMQELFGDLLRKENKYEKGIMFNGFGRNGKSKTLTLIKTFMGADNCCSISLQQLEDDQYAISNLHGKMVNLAGDLSRTALKNTGNFKNCIGRDSITANRKNRTHIQFVNYAKMFFACNELPISYDNTEGFWSKWLYFDFPYKFLPLNEYELLSKEEQVNFRIMNEDIIIALTTSEELSGLLNWALDGLERLDKQHKYSDNKTTEEIKMIWLRKSNSLKAFCMDFIKEDYDGYITKKEFAFVYSNYCRQNKLHIINDKYIKDMLMNDFGVTDDRISINSERIYVWQGMKFKDKITTIKEQTAYPAQETYPFSKRLETKSFIASRNTIGNQATLGSSYTKFNSKALIHNPCCYPKGYDGCCGKTPCNDLEGINYCQEHFEVIQEQNNLKTKEIDLRASNEV